jgi:DNA-binding NtrC family response regulator
MRLLTGADILAFSTSRSDRLAITTSGEFVHLDAADLNGRTDSYSYATTEDGDEVQVLLDADGVEGGDWFPDALDENGDLIPSVADEMAHIINNDAGLYTRLQVAEIREATAAWEDSARETNRLADDRARRIAAFVQHCGGNQSHAARILGLDQSTVNKLVKKAQSATA